MSIRYRKHSEKILFMFKIFIVIIAIFTCGKVSTLYYEKLLVIKTFYIHMHFN